MEHVNIEQEVLLFKIVLAANYFDVSSLGSHLCCGASMTKGENTEEIKKPFIIVRHFTPEGGGQDCHAGASRVICSVIPAIQQHQVMSADAGLFQNGSSSKEYAL